MTNEIYEKLVEKYGEKACTLYNNGVVEVRVKNDSVYIPTTNNTNNLFSYFPGMGGRGNDSVTPVKDVTTRTEPIDYILSISNQYYDNNNSMLFATDVAKTVGYNIDNVSLTTFSASGGIGFKRLEEYLEIYPDVNASMVACDGYNLEHPTSNKYFKNIDLLVEKEVPIIMLGPSNSKRFKNVTDDLSSTGLNFYKVYTDRTAHININNDALINGFQEYILGARDTLNYDRSNNNIDACNYQIYRYDPNNPNSDEKGYVLISLDDNELLNYLGNSTYPTIKNNISFTSEGTVASDLYLVTEAMRAINDSIRSNNALRSHAVAVNSTSSIPARLFDAQSSVLDITAGVVGNLSQETQLIANMANVIYQMDKDLANRASDLSNGTNLLTAYSSQINNELNNVISTNILSSLNIASSLFSPGSHTIGSVGKICASDLKSMYSGGQLIGVLKNNIDAEITDARNTKNQINSFRSVIGNSKNLQGEMWNQVSKKLDKYSSLMDLRVESMGKLEAAYIKALQIVTDYIGDYDELDDSKLPELKESLLQLEKAIENARVIMTATHTEAVSSPSDPTKVSYVAVYDYSASERAAAKAYIEWAVEQHDEISRLIEKLEGLPDIMSQAEQVVNDTLCEIYGKYGVEANNVVTGRTASYIPPTNTSYSSPRLNEAAFNANSSLVNDYGTYANYKNYEKTSTYDSVVYNGIGKLSRSAFNLNTALVNQYGTYEDYLAGVEKEYNTAYNTSLNINEKTSGLDFTIPGQSIISKFESTNNTEINNNIGSSSESSYSSGSNSSSGTNTVTNTTESTNTAPTATKNNTSNQTVTETNTTETKTIDSNETKNTKQEASNKEQVINKTYNYYNGGSSNNNSSKKASNLEVKKDEEPLICPPGYEQEPINPVIEPIDEPIEEPIIEPITEPEDEPDIIEPIPDIQVIDDIVLEQEVMKDDNSLKTVGIIAGAGLAVGAAALGAYEYKKAKDDDEYNEEDEEY